MPRQHRVALVVFVNVIQRVIVFVFEAVVVVVLVIRFVIVVFASSSDASSSAHPPRVARDSTRRRAIPYPHSSHAIYDEHLFDGS